MKMYRYNDLTFEGYLAGNELYVTATVFEQLRYIDTEFFNMYTVRDARIIKIYNQFIGVPSMTEDRLVIATEEGDAVVYLPDEEIMPGKQLYPLPWSLAEIEEYELTDYNGYLRNMKINEYRFSVTIEDDKVYVTPEVLQNLTELNDELRNKFYVRHENVWFIGSYRIVVNNRKDLDDLTDNLMDNISVFKRQEPHNGMYLIPWTMSDIELYSDNEILTPMAFVDHMYNEFKKADYDDVKWGNSQFEVKFRGKVIKMANHADNFAIFEECMRKLEKAMFND